VRENDVTRCRRKANIKRCVMGSNEESQEEQAAALNQPETCWQRRFSNMFFALKTQLFEACAQSRKFSIKQLN
jgi:hypothetical protein